MLDWDWISHIISFIDIIAILLFTWQTLFIVTGWCHCHLILAIDAIDDYTLVINITVLTRWLLYIAMK